MTFADFLHYAAGPGVSAVVGVVLALVAEYIPAYQALAPKQKVLVFIAACFVLPLLAATLLGACGFEPWSFDPLYWQAIVAGFVASGIGTLAHTPQKAS